MSKKLIIFLVFAAVGLLASCATGSRSQEKASQAQAIPEKPLHQALEKPPRATEKAVGTMPTQVPLAYTEAPATEQAHESDSPALYPFDARYRIHAGDILIVSVWKEEDLTLEVLVQPDGRFAFPLAGHIIAQGKTTDEIAAELSKRVEQYIPEPVVTVTLREIEGNVAYVVGKVNKPGPVVMYHDMDVMQALSLAGGTTPFASLNSIKILRTVGGKQRAIPFRYGDVEDGEYLEQNITLQSGDVIVVP